MDHLPRIVSEEFNVSMSEARRVITTGGVRINDQLVTELDLELPPEFDLQVGRKEKSVKK